MSTKQKIKRGLLNTIQFAAMLAMSLIAADALAQNIDISLGDLQAAAENDGFQDAALRMFQGVFGEEFASTNPFSAAGSSTTLLGDVFLVFNAIVLGIGVAFSGYLIVAVITQSANDGEALGKNADTVWMPVRFGLGIFGMLPVVGGFSVFQAITMGATILGLGAGNMIAGKALDAAADFKAITPAYSTAGAAPNLSADVHDVVRGAVLAEMCHQGQIEFAQMLEASGNVRATYPTIKRYNTRKSVGFDYGTCGKIEMSKRSSTWGRAADHISTDIRSGSSKLGFRVAAVDYESIAAAVQSAAEAELGHIQAGARQISREWFDAAFAKQPQPIAEIGARAYQQSLDLEKASRARLNNQIKAAAASDTGAIEADVLETMKAGGWMQMGSFYSVYAESSAALADAQRAFQLKYVPGREVMKIIDGKVSGAWHSEPMRHFLQFASMDAPSDDKGRIGQLLDMMNPIPPENEMGERSVGQEIVKQLTATVARDSGGAGLVNPVTAAKNLGDWLMVGGQAGLAGAGIIEMLPAGKGLKVAAVMSPTVEKLGDLINSLLYAFIFIGMFLSIFIPMLFWSTWISAILAYLSGVMQALIYAQLAAFSHLKTDGYKLVEPGSSGAKFYVYLMNCLFRPGVMVISFIIASALLTFVGTFMLEGFTMAMGAAQGNSVTGLLSVVGFLLLFCVVLFGLVQVCANLMISIPDALLGWIGGQNENNNGVVLGAALGAALRNGKGPTGGGGGQAIAKVAPGTAAK